MATVTGKARTTGENRIAFRASWDFYQSLARAIGDQPVRLAFDGERIELMSPGPLHERDRARLERLVTVLSEELDLPLLAMGSTRWDRPESWRGLEADATFYLTDAKVEASLHRSPDAVDYPIPDLAIEVDHSPPRIDRDSAYVALGVPEVWKYDGDELLMYRLGPDGTYIEVSESVLLKIRTSDLTVWMNAEARDDNHLGRLFRAWVASNPVN